MTEQLNSLTVRPETIKLLEENRGKTLYDINHSKILYDPPSPVMKIKTNKYDIIKLKSFCTTKETINKVKRQPSEWKKIIANETIDKGLHACMLSCFSCVQLFMTLWTVAFQALLSREFSR